MAITVSRRKLKEIIVITIIVLILAVILRYVPLFDDTPQGGMVSDFNNQYNEQMKKSVGKIGLYSSNSNKIEYVGTGFVVDKEGYVVTAKHNYEHYAKDQWIEAVNQAGFFSIKDETGMFHEFRVKLISDQNLHVNDVLLLKIDGKPNFDLKPVEIGSKEDVYRSLLDIGLVGYTIVDEDEMQVFSHTGKISNTDYYHKPFTKPIYTANIGAQGGFSGAPTFLMTNGRVIGVIDSGVISPTITLIVPIDEIPELVGKHKSQN